METKIYYYHFDIGNPSEKQAYVELRKKLTQKGMKCFDSISLRNGNWYRDVVKPLHGKSIALETNHVFNNQWNTAPTETSENGLRVFDWAEAIYLNREIKTGMYLDITPEMKAIRDNMVKCGYCGHMEEAQRGNIFCPKCLDSEYLEEKDLFLLRLKPISWKGERKKLTKSESEWLLPQYKEAQIHGTTERGKKRIKQLRERLLANRDKSINNANTEYNGFIWLLDHGINTNNCIYYNHTGKFSFGWRKPISESLKSELLDILVEFPFEYEIKTN